MNDARCCSTLAELYFDDALSWFFKTDSLSLPKMKPIWFPAPMSLLHSTKPISGISPFGPVERNRAPCLCLSYSHLANILFGFYILSVSHQCQILPPSRIPQDFPPQDKVFAIKADPWEMVESSSSISSSATRRSFQYSTKCLHFIRSGQMEKRTVPWLPIHHIFGLKWF